MESSLVIQLLKKLTAVIKYEHCQHPIWLTTYFSTIHNI